MRVVYGWTLLACGSLAAVAAAAPQLQLSNDRLELSIDFSLENGHCRLRDLQTGETYSAADFGVIRAWDNTEDRMRTVLLTPDAKTSRCRLEIEQTSPTQAVIHVDTGGGSASAMGTMSFGIAFDVTLSLSGECLEYAIPIASLREQESPPGIPQRWRLMEVELFPLLGATPAGEPGGLLIPSWCGAIYYFDRSHPRANRAFETGSHADLGTPRGILTRWGYDPQAPAEYGSMVYGEQAAWEDQLQLPVYATLRERGGLMGILLSGEYDTRLVARRHQGAHKTASLTPVWRYRRYWHSKLDRVDRRVRLIALGPGEASFVGVGTRYRDYLTKERGVPTLRERATRNPAVKYFLEGAYFRVMMGMKRSALDGRGAMRSFQSWDAFADAVALFQQAGFEKINFIFVGANYEGHDGAHPTVFPLEPAHGGEAGLRRVVQRLDAAGYRAGLHLNYKDAYRCSPDWDPAFIQINEYGELRYHGAWIGGYSYQAIPQEMLARFGRRDLPKLRALGLHGLHYWDACLSVMEETFPPNRVITRREYGEGAIDYFRYAADLFGAVACETTIAPLLGIIVHAGNVSYPYSGASQKMNGNGYCEAGLLDHWVPLQHIVYHGLCAYTGGPELAGRIGYEFNATPTAAEVQTLRRRFIESQAWNGNLVYEFITDYQRVASGRTRTTFSDGSCIRVNATDEPWHDGTVTVAPQSHLVQREGS